jgi:hypothetical protein
MLSMALMLLPLINRAAIRCKSAIDELQYTPNDGQDADHPASGMPMREKAPVHFGGGLSEKRKRNARLVEMMLSPVVIQDAPISSHEKNFCSDTKPFSGETLLT